MVRIVIFGDSIVRGGDDYKEGGWVQRLNIDSKRQINGLSIYNCGIAGDSTTELLERLETEAKARLSKQDKNIVIFSIGINDTQTNLNLKETRTHINQFETNINYLIKIAKKYFNQIIFLGFTDIIEKKLQPTQWNKNVYYKTNFVNEFNEIIEKTAISSDCKFISMKGIVSEEFLVDGLHPSPDGHEQIFRKIKDELKKLN